MDNRFFRPLGTLCILASLPMIEAGIPTARAFFRIDYLRWSLSALATIAAFLLLIAGIVLCAKRIAGRRIAYCAAAASIFAIFLAAIIHLAGGHAVLYGVGYPIVIVLLLRRATPSNDIHIATGHSATSPPTGGDRHYLKSALA